MKKILFFALLLFPCSLCFAQRITGVVMNPENAPIEFANILLFNATDSTYITGAVSDEEGKFVINIPQGKNISSTMLKVSCLGYETVWITPKQSSMVITLQEKELSVNEVVVTGKTPAFRMTQEGIVTNIAGTTLANLGTGEDVLAHIPGVIKNKNSIEVLGKGTPLIYINGRKVLNTTDIENIKSEDIKNVEVITSPGAKYDSNVNAVIKIQTKRPVGDGFGFNLSSNYKQGRCAFFREQASWNYRKGGLDVFGNHTFHNYQYYRVANHTTTTKADTLWHQTFKETSYTTNAAFMNNIGFNYQLSKRASIGAKYSIWLYPETDEHISTTTKAFADGKIYDESNTNSRSTDKNHPGHSANIYYQGVVGKVSLGVDADYLHNKSKSIAYYDEISTYLESRDFESQNIVRNNMFAIKMTAGFKALAANITLGTEYTNTKQDNTYINSKNYVESSESSAKETHFSPFVEMRWKLQSYSIRTGLRYENVWSDYSKNGNRIDEQSRYYGNLYPNISLSTPIGKTKLFLSYAAKTRRPSYWELRSNVTYANRYNYQSGNPLLNKELQHNITMWVIWKYFQFCADYKDRRNAIIYWKDLYNESGSITYTSFRNIKSLKRFYFMMAASPQIGIWSPRLTFMLNKQWHELKHNDKNMKMNSPQFDVFFSNSFNFNKEWMAFVDMHYISSGNYENCYRTKNRFYTNITLSKKILSNMFTIQTGINDIFNLSKNGTDLYYPNIVTTQTEWKDERQFFISLRYNFNTAKSKYKGTGAGNSEKNRM